jgi:hypothetical protein
LAAKAFLFGKNADAFEDSTDAARKNGHLEALREEWRKQGPVGKLHNTVKFIRCTPQRREVFEGLMKDELPRNISGKLPPSSTLDAKTKLRGLGTSESSLIAIFSPNGHFRQRHSMEFYLFVYGKSFET